jgi:hypothetical protein
MTHHQRDAETGAVTVSAFVRPTMLLEPMDAKLATLYSLREEGVIDDLTVRAWPEKVPESPGTPYSDAFDVFELFETWAEATGVSVRPPFDVERTESAFRGGSRAILRTPVMSLAVSVDDKLCGVFPHTDGDTHYRVTEAIAALKADSLPLTPADTDTASEPGTCPDCGGELVNVQGIRVCHDCAWNDWMDVGDERAGTEAALFRPTILPSPG